MALTLEQVEKMIDAACQKAAAAGIRAGVAVVDAGGHLIAFKRMDGAGLVTVDMSIGKAFTAVAFGFDTLMMSQVMGQMTFFAAGPELAGGRIVPLGGGVPIRQGGDLAGAIGVGGGSPEQDDECAKAGITTLG